MIRGFKLGRIAGFVLLLFGINTVFAQNDFVTESGSEPPTTKAILTDIGHKFIKVLNTASEETAVKVAHEIFKESSAEDWAKSFRKEYGKVTSGKIRLTEGEQYSTVHVIVKLLKTEEWRNFQLVSKNEGDYKTERINIVLAAEPSNIPDGKFTDPDVISSLTKYARKLGKEGGLSASVLIMNGDEVLTEEVYGLANHEAKRKVDANTPFNLASMSKMFTAVAVLKLVQEGEISLDDPLQKFLPNYANKDYASKTTVMHLLSHSSGVGEFWDAEYEKSWDKISRLDQYLPFIQNKPVRFDPPGSQGSYSNSGFILLGLIIEKATGQNYYEHINETIFKPLGMDNSGFYRKDQEELVAVGYLDLGEGRVIKERGGLMGSSAGGGYSTSRDLIKFRNALVNHKLLNKETFELATSEQISLDGGGMRYGYGFAINDGFASGFGHGGQGPGAGTLFNADKSSDLTVIILSNKLNGAYSELMFTLKELMKR